MQRLLILGTMPDLAALRRDGFAAADCGIVSVSPSLSERLDESGIGQRSVLAYLSRPEWPSLHADLGRQLAELGTAAPAATDRSWLDDFSHFIVAELRHELFWIRAAREIARAEQPRALHVQSIPTSHPAHAALSSLAAAFDRLGLRATLWSPGGPP